MLFFSKNLSPFFFSPSLMYKTLTPRNTIPHQKNRSAKDASCIFSLMQIIPGLFFCICSWRKGVPCTICPSCNVLWPGPQFAVKMAAVNPTICRAWGCPFIAACRPWPLLFSRQVWNFLLTSCCNTLFSVSSACSPWRRRLPSLWAFCEQHSPQRPHCSTSCGLSWFWGGSMHTKAAHRLSGLKSF